MSDHSEIIERKLNLNSSPEKVWQALTDPVQLSKWFGQTAKFELIEGAIGYFGWQDHGKFAMRIEKIIPQRFFSWRWMTPKDASFDLTQSTLVEWSLVPLDDGGTKLTMIESGFKSEKSFQDNVGGWTHELAELVESLGEESL